MVTVIFLSLVNVSPKVSTQSQVIDAREEGGDESKILKDYVGSERRTS